jgi:hypothetical protein
MCTDDAGVLLLVCIAQGWDDKGAFRSTLISGRLRDDVVVHVHLSETAIVCIRPYSRLAPWVRVYASTTRKNWDTQPTRGRVCSRARNAYLVPMRRDSLGLGLS